MAAKTQAILTKEQIGFLDLVSSEPYLCRNFYFTGGTPLAAFYLHHRLSEDIDLFSEQEVKIIPIRTFLKKAQNKLGFKKIDYRQFLGLHTFQLFFSETNILKVDFNYYPFPRIEPGKPYKNLSVDSEYDIAVNKVHMVVMKPRARDFIDLYFIMREKKYDWHDLLKQAEAKFDWHIDAVQLGSRLLAAADATDYPRMLKPIKHEEWKQFFLDKAAKLKKNIFE
ncbi:MAG: hypothetical protein EXS55_02350 [Candidatus Magasanikbacteria bacterium]|nr:hypothetical protein [Candidatus Magasanikbacteria bacterium]